MTRSGLSAPGSGRGGVGAAARGGTKDAKGSVGIAGLGWVLEATRWRSAGVAELHASGCADGPHAAAGGGGKTMLEGERS